MQLREEIRAGGYGTKECPANDWMCKYFENGTCKLQNAEKLCDFMKNGKDNKLHSKSTI